MDAVIEDALVEWYETERVARAAGAEVRRADVIDFEAVRHRQSPALARLFGVIEKTVAEMSLLQPANATDRHRTGVSLEKSESRAHA